MFKIFRRNSENRPPSTDRAAELMRSGDFEGALKEADALIQLAPAIALSHRFKGEVLFSMGRYDDSIRSLEEATRLGGIGTHEIFFWIALAHSNSGRHDQAIKLLKDYIDSPGASAELSDKCRAAIASISEDLSPD